jgi:hypothetical protein
MGDQYISKSELFDALIYCKGLGRHSLEAVIKTINEQPTVDEKTIVRKTVKRIADKLKEASFPANFGITDLVVLKERAIEICKEEGGISE